jgi:SAM-dependent methyltransferase
MTSTDRRAPRLRPVPLGTGALAAEDVLWLRDQHLRDSVVAGAHELVTDVLDRTGACLALELGAGRGMLTDHLAAAGCEVEAVTASDAGAAILRHRFRHNPRVRVLHDPDHRGLATGRPLGAALCVSALQLDPDYLLILRQLIARLRPGGSLLCTNVPPAQPARRRLGLMVGKGLGIPRPVGRGRIRAAGAPLWAGPQGQALSGYDLPPYSEYAGPRSGLTAEYLATFLQKRFRHIDVRYHTSRQRMALSTRLCGFAPPPFTIMASDLLNALP